MNRTAAVLPLIVAALATGGAAAQEAGGAARPAPARVAPNGPSPSGFHQGASNPYFPLRPGTVTVLHGQDDGQRYRERVLVTRRTRMVQGVRTRVVSDVVRRTDGSLAERTRDWYATDDTGRVWYFGEATATYDRHGRLLDRDGSWQAGVDGAVAGTIMPAHPRATQAFRQELQRGEAEDQAWVVQTGARVRTPAGRFRDVVRTFEWSRLEKDVVSTKLYARGIGIVLERDLSGGDETFVLVRVHRP
jgi:hypothetical protein